MKELLEKRAKIAEQARQLVLKAETEARALSPEEMVAYDKYLEDVKAIGETIERSRRSADLDVELSKSIGPRGETQQRATAGSDLASASMDTFIRSGVESLTKEQRGLFGPVAGYRDAIQLRTAPTPLSVSTQYGGAEVVPQGFVYNLEKALLAYSGVRQAGATILRTSTGNPMPWPTMNDTGNVGEIVGENSAVNGASSEMSFDKVTFGAFKYSSKLVLVPIELIQDSAFDVQAFVADALGTRLGRIQNTHFTTGTGTSLPWGVIAKATSGYTTTTSATAVTMAEINTLVHSVDPAYRANAKFMFNDATALALENILDGGGRPLLNPTLAGYSQSVKAGDVNGPSRYSIYGYPVVINTAMANMASQAKAIAFGDFSKYVIREVLDLMLVRFGELYMASGQIGFLAFMRADGNLVDAGTHPVKFLTQKT